MQQLGEMYVQNTNADFRNKSEICLNNKVKIYFFPIFHFVPSENISKPFSGGGGQKGTRGRHGIVAKVIKRRGSKQNTGKKGDSCQSHSF